MRIPSLLILVCLASPSVRAQDKNDDAFELAKRVARASEKAVVAVVTLHDRDGKRHERVGVIAGSPPLLIVPDRGRMAPTLQIRAHNGSHGTAELRGVDEEFGVAFYAASWRGDAPLALSFETKMPTADSVGVLGYGGAEFVQLLRVRGPASEVGLFTTAGPSPSTPVGTPLVSSDGGLLGIYAGSKYEDPVVSRNFVRRSVTGLFLGASVLSRAVSDITNHGRIRRGFLGIVIEQAPGGGRVASVLKGSPAASGGLIAGDVITAIDGVICDAERLSRELALRRPGDRVTLRIARLDQDVLLTLGNRAEEEAFWIGPQSLGLEVIELGPSLRAYLHLPKGQRGVVVERIEEGSIAEQAGLTRGDVVTEGGGGAIADVAEFKAALVASRGWIELLVVRTGESLPLAIAIRAPVGSR